MKNDSLERFIHDNADEIFDNLNLKSADHRDKFALKLGAASRPWWCTFRLDSVLSAAIFLVGIFLIQNSNNYIAVPATEIENYKEVANYFIGDVNNRIDSLIIKTEGLDKESRELIVADLNQMKEENNNMIMKDPKYNVDAFEAAVMVMSQRQNEVLNSMEQSVIAKNN